MNSIFTVIRHRKIKSLLFLVDDLWLYQYHKPQYLGLPQIVFESVRIIESKKDEIFGIQKIQFINDIEDQIKKYDEMANKKYLKL